MQKKEAKETVTISHFNDWQTGIRRLNFKTLFIMTYAEKLKDPRWQRKRLEILERDDFTCQCCKSKEKTLHVHHKAYISGKEPWDYTCNYLLTLCHECHNSEEDSKKALQHYIIEALLCGYTYNDLCCSLASIIIDEGMMDKNDRITVSAKISSSKSYLMRLKDEIHNIPLDYLWADNK